MTIPVDQLESTMTILRELVYERTSAPHGDYTDEETANDDLDLRDIEKIKTVHDAFMFLRDQGQRIFFVEYASCLDPLHGFKVQGKEWPHDEDEKSFRNYLTETYGITKKDFP